MKTDDLIGILAKDAAPVTPMRRIIVVPAALGAAGAIALFLAFIHVRVDIGAALETWRFKAKLGLIAVAVAAMAYEYWRLLRPNADPRLWPVAAIGMALAALVTVELTALPADHWAMSMRGKNAMMCLTTIPFLAALPLVAALWAMRQGAPSSPTMAGAVAGGIAAAFGALLYATHCNDDSPLFVALWYPLAAGIVVTAGALAGRIMLRW